MFENILQVYAYDIIKGPTIMILNQNSIVFPLSRQSNHLSVLFD
jgi:hypothetical protein